MKTIIGIILIIILSINANAQLTKKLQGDEYTLIDTVLITNGHGDDIPVLFTIYVQKDKWETYLAVTKVGDDKDGAMMVGMAVSLMAQGHLKNGDSFEPFKKQIVTWTKDDIGFTCLYGMMGRDGLGNLGEVKEIVVYTPREMSNK
jgi:methionine synthase I (cobalamin-dependent)